MILPPNWTQLHATNHGEFVEVTIHFAGPWIRMGTGMTLDAAVTCAMKRAPIAMGDDHPAFALVEDLDVQPEGAA